MTIRTPEGVTFHLPLGSPVSRFLAWMVDAGCLLAAFQVIKVLIGLLGSISTDLSVAATTVVFFVLRTCYAIFLEWRWQGQTVGKRVMGLRVMDVNGLRMQPGQIIIRNLLRAVDSLPLFYLVGGIAALVSRYGQRLGDLAANTIVVAQDRTPPPDLESILAKNRYNSLKAYPHLVARLRQRVTPEEAGLTLQALVRRDQLQPDARVRLFTEMAGHFKDKATFPAEVIEGMSDEQYVRNVIDVLFKA